MIGIAANSIEPAHLLNSFSYLYRSNQLTNFHLQSREESCNYNFTNTYIKGF